MLAKVSEVFIDDFTNNTNKGKETMAKFSMTQAKQYFLNEDATALAISCTELQIEKLAQKLELDGYDGDYAFSLWESGKEEMRCLMHEAMIEFGLV